jgi:hypothetical protein
VVGQGFGDEQGPVGPCGVADAHPGRGGDEGCRVRQVLLGVPGGELERSAVADGGSDDGDEEIVVAVVVDGGGQPCGEVPGAWGGCGGAGGLGERLAGVDGEEPGDGAPPLPDGIVGGWWEGGGGRPGAEEAGDDRERVGVDFDVDEAAGDGVFEVVQAALLGGVVGHGERHVVAEVEVTGLPLEQEPQGGGLDGG